MTKIMEINEKIAEGVVGGYKKMESGIVEGFGKVTDKYVEKLFTKSGRNTCLKKQTKWSSSVI